MGTAFLAFSDLLSPLQSLADRWLAPRRQARRNELRYVAIRPDSGHRAAVASKPDMGAPAARPLRVVRVVDEQTRPSQAGRVVISGRMSDVCAELDRLVALEARGTASVAPALH
ncbi:hypothetical protein QTH91_14080 [Variovorax dokdonensis]|uniref:Uncharacterized protein n=1 Tax=Variovorax dokdonensis TaxID=344883 RepID=A0ABT7NCF8_9BURK|nr:hypothetical protein [Variovorax dokdonensis]MDM0045618.1 hypothetical protein [Variovorax dokdonensis]